MQHGLTGDGVVLPVDMRLELDGRRRLYIGSFQPVTLDDFDLIHRAALGIVRFNQLQPMFSRRAEQRAWMAASHWPLLRELEAIERSRRLIYDPPGVIARLKTNIGGVGFLLNEWKLLRLALDTNGDWTPKQVERAQNLAGVPRIHRQLDPHKVRHGGVEERRALVDRQITDLERLLVDPELARLDEEERRGIVARLDEFDDPMFDRLLRYEQRALRMHQTAIRELNQRLVARGEPPLAAELPDRPPSRRLIRTSADDPGVEPIADQPTVAEPTPPGVLMSETAVVPPFGGNCTKEQYLSRITDPDCIARYPVAELPGADNLMWTRLANWLGVNRLQLDLTTSMRGLLGHMSRRAEELSAAHHLETKAVPDTVLADQDRADRARKDRRKAQKLARKRNR